MFILNTENIIEYLRPRLPEVIFDSSTMVRQIGDGSSEEDGDGYLNYVFKVSTGSFSCIVKQALGHMRHSMRELPASRNKLEYDILTIRSRISPEYVPTPYFYDEDNHIFAMEDCSHLKISRFQFAKNIVYDHFGENCAKYLAATHFFTSEYFLETDAFRGLTTHFMSPKLRQIMADAIFVTLFGHHEFDAELGEEFVRFAKSLAYAPELECERYKLRHSFITNGECLVHGDLHTSNMFAGDNALKVIDMEFTFTGPFSFDMGYLAGNLIAQYTSAIFRDFPSEKERNTFKQYILHTIRTLYTTYVTEFCRHCDAHCKDFYKDVPGLQEDFKKTILRDYPGFTDAANWSRASDSMPYPDYDVITDLKERCHAVTMSLMIDWQIMFNRYHYKTIDDFIRDIEYVERRYLKHIGRL
jgi:5-methylthioribose kinase